VCALAPAGSGSEHAIERLARDVTDWPYLGDAAALAQLRPRLAALLARVQPGGDGARGALRSLAADVEAHRGRGRLLAAELLRILDGLAKAGVAAVPFKGPALAAWVGQPSIPREMNDLDVLLEPRDLPAAVRAMAAIGYRPMLAPQAVASTWLARVTHELPLGGGALPLLELHWRLAPAWFPAAVDAREVLARSGERDLFGTRVRAASAEELLLMHVSDGMKSGGWGFRWLGDVADIVRAHSRMDWPRVAATASAHGALAGVKVALALAQDLAEEAASALEAPQVALALPGEAAGLAAQARASARLASAMQAIRRRLATDAAELGSPLRHFAWAVRTADHPLKALAGVVRHLAGPSVSDLESMPAAGLTDAALRAAAWRRRLAGVAR
jgi:hypothetical protein